MVNRVTLIFTTPGPGYFIIPNDFGSVYNIEAIGGGMGPIASNGGGGGAYASSTTLTGLGPGVPVYYNVGIGGTVSSPAGGNSWISTSNIQPTDSSIGIMAAGAFLTKTSQRIVINNATASFMYQGGQANVCIYNSTTGIAYSGGNGGANNDYSVNGSGYAYGGGSGGGGAAGPNGPGGTGGANKVIGSVVNGTLYLSYMTMLGGGGGGADGGSNGQVITGSYTAGNGGDSGSFIGSGGIGANLNNLTVATNSINGGGGGGSASHLISNGQSGTPNVVLNSSNASFENYWNGVIIPDTGLGPYVGPGGGGGGGAYLISDLSINVSGTSGIYGGGAGGIGATNSTILSGGNGVVVFSYLQYEYNVHIPRGITIQGNISING